MAGLALIISLTATGCAAAPSGSPHATPVQASSFDALGGVISVNEPGDLPPGWQVKDPFAGTPAETWRDNTAGFVMPRLVPVGHFSAGQEASAFQATGNLLAAAYLDKQTLFGGQPAAFASLLTSEQRTWFLGNLNKKGVTKDGLPVSTRAMVMAFPPGQAQLTGDVVKVNGGMRAAAASYQGHPVLEVHADYIFVYPVEPPGYPAKWTRVVAQVRWTVRFGDWAASPWVSVVGHSLAGVKCGAGDGYAHPDYPNARKALSDPAGSPGRSLSGAYKFRAAGAEAGGCQAAMRT